jgi:hypothetical protein
MNGARSLKAFEQRPMKKILADRAVEHSRHPNAGVLSACKLLRTQFGRKI